MADSATILIIEDDEDTSKMLARGLEQEGYTCLLSKDGVDGEKKFATAAVDLAIVDVRLPGIDGVEVVTRIKARAGTEVFLPVILITGHDDVEERVRGFRAGCEDFLGKPISLFELGARVRSLLARRAQHKELATANAKLLEVQQKKQMLAALVVHDLRNPLSALQGNVELLREELTDDNEFVGEILDDLRGLAARSLTLVAGLLDVEELEEGLLQADIKETILSDFVHEAAGNHWATIKARKLAFEFDVATGLKASLDPDLVGRLVENLLDNAVRYAPRRGKVVVSASFEDGKLVFRVGNDGPEIPEDQKEMIFDRYYRIEARRAGARANRGLGLYFCKLVAEAHGGTIEVESIEGLPACFTVRLPQDEGARAT